MSERRRLHMALAAAAGSSAAAYILRKRWNNPAPPTDSAVVLEELRNGSTNPLLDRFPTLRDRLPWRPLGSFPSPVQRIPSPSPGAAHLFLKRDDGCSRHYAGNKLRKLEYLLADAELRGRRTLVTLGAIGSNHALATAIHGRRLGLDVHLVLYDQPLTPFVWANLEGMIAAGASIHYAGTIARAAFEAARLEGRLKRMGRFPYLLMVGGSSPLGCAGYITAGLELATQVQAGELPEPDAVVVPLGTCGTAAGLIVGLRLAGLQTRVVAVRVADPIAANRIALRYLAQRAADLLHRLDRAVPKLVVRPSDFDVVTDQFGEGYGRPTAEGVAALRWAAPFLELESTYTAKTMAACIRLCIEERSGSRVLF